MSRLHVSRSGLPLLLAMAWLGMPGCGDPAKTGSERDAGEDPRSTADDPRDPSSWEEEIIDPTELPSEVPIVEIAISAQGQASLEAAPFYGDDVVGDFVDGEGRRHTDVDISYRGAYQLMSLINGDPLGRRNWKVKFAKGDQYRGRREWNFNFEPHLRQKLAYDLMRFAGVKVPSAEHVLLKVNGEPQGLYLQYEDPDSKDWLWDKFGDDSGDLYKAATDTPASPSEGEPEMKYFADTTYLGDLDSDYHYHYRKMTNRGDSAGREDSSVLRDFLDGLNHSSDSELAPWVDGHFDIDAFLSYLVVSNFISNWDSFPARPKNYWLYENRRTGQMVFVPWDLDNTFQTWVDDFNQMGPDAPLLFCLKSTEYRPIHQEEGTERPLTHRIINTSAFEEAYIARYEELAEGILSSDYLEDRVDSLAALVSPHLTGDATSRDVHQPSTERSDFENALGNMREFIADRTASVEAQLSSR